jgi:hypothetical protein
MFGSAIHRKTASDPAKKQRKTQRKRWAERCSTGTRKSNMRISVLPALLAVPTCATRARYSTWQTKCPTGGPFGQSIPPPTLRVLAGLVLAINQRSSALLPESAKPLTWLASFALAGSSHPGIPCGMASD